MKIKYKILSFVSMDEYKHLTEDQIAVFAEAISSGTESSLPEEWRKHVAECEQCAHEVSMVSQLIDEGIDASNETSQKKYNFLSSRKFYTRFAIAASFLVILGAGIFFTIMFTGNQQENLTNLKEDQTASDSIENQFIAETEDKDSVKIQRKKDTGKNKKKVKTNPRNQDISNKKIKLAYVPDEQLEKLADRFRESNFRGNNISVISPNEIHVKQGSDITLKFENPDKKTVILEFFDNNGKKLFETVTSSESYNNQNITEPGLYYWKMLSEDFDLIYCGKIIIE